ncbi:MAG TPA: GNAT family N-acetyltransferase [Steroidobacter sp.]|jgi:ribosomal protein S18 acetylase RimI-like enzyme|nr:GNAT family N-acetyltransferase [Steroidobacteraceae bacterium]HLS80121.1 GNAT family N-acetyltransferase [Steroidobacter sp.]
MLKLAARSADLNDAELAALGEHIEARAWTDMVAAAPGWLRRATALKVQEIGGALMLSAPGLNHLWFNRVIGLGERSMATEKQIAEIMARYWDLGVDRYWVHVGPCARPARLGRLLQEQGLVPHRRSWVKLVRPARRAEAVRTALRVRPAHVDDAIAVGSIVGAGFELPQRAAEVFTHLIDRPRWRVFVAESDGRVVAAAGMFMEGEVSYLAFAATREEFRRQGAQQALLEARINAAADADSRWVATETGFPLTADEPNPSYRNLLSAGFRATAIRENYSLPGACWGAIDN